MNILLVEDDIFWRTELLMLMDELNYNDLHVCKDIVHFQQYLKTNKPDLIIADVLLGEHTIFDHLSFESLEDTPILFMTISEDSHYFEHARKFPRSLYLVKPFHKLSLKSSIENLLNSKATDSAIDNTSKAQKSIIVRGQFQEKITLTQDSIVFIRSELAYCIIKTSKSQFALKHSLQKSYNEFHPHFIKTHRSYIVNKKFIQKIDLRKMVVLTEAGEIPISRFYKKEIIYYFNSIRAI